MKLLLPQAAIVIALERGEALSLQDAQGFRILPERGTVWVTQERFDADDIIGPGDRLTLGMPGRTVVQALSAAVVRIAKDGVATENPRATGVLVADVETGAFSPDPSS